MSAQKGTYSIGKVSSLCNVSIKTLRYYDEIGLLIPDCRKDNSNYRYYTHEQILTLFIIRKLRHLGVPLKEIKDIIGRKDAESMEKCIRQRLEEINHAIEALNDQYAEGQFYQNDCDLEISIQVNEAADSPAAKEFGGFPAVTALHIGRNEDIIQTHIKAIKWLNQRGYTIAGPISEEYIISPVDIENEADHITRVIIPIEKTEN